MQGDAQKRRKCSLSNGGRRDKIEKNGKRRMNLEQQEILNQVPERLLGWYGKNARILPWRDRPEPYRVWVSEIMLQQTRVEAVKPYYERFLRELPTVRDLAEAPEEQLLKLWEGLGYYNRVRNLQKGARKIVEDYGGEVPPSFEALRGLPGIGDYTAGAIASIAFGIPVPAVDGNVLRVRARVLNDPSDILNPKVKKLAEEQIKRIIPKDRAGDFNQALMELGAMVCLPNGVAKCLYCPLNGICTAYREGTVMELPVKTKKQPRKIEEKTVFLISCGKAVALRRRPEKGLLSGLWELPWAEGFLNAEDAERQLEAWRLQPRQLRELDGAKHIFTHIEWRMHAFQAEAGERTAGFEWVSREDLQKDVTLPFAFKAYFQEIDRLLA